MTCPMQQRNFQVIEFMFIRYTKQCYMLHKYDVFMHVSKNTRIKNVEIFFY